MVLEMKNIKKSFGDVEVLKDISLGVDTSEVVSIIGPSGSGKSTLLRCATFLETIDSGEISYTGTPAVTTGADGKAEYVSPAELRKAKQRTRRSTYRSATRMRSSPKRKSSFARWTSLSVRMPTPASSPADSSSVWPLPAHWP